MDIICMQCGAKLPRADARYCNNCGALVSSKPVPTSSATKESTSSPMKNAQQYSSRPPLREQIAQQPPARPLQHSASSEPSAWMSRLEPGTQSRTRPDPLRMKRTTEKERVEPVSPQQDVADKPTQASLAATGSVRDVAQPSVLPPASAARQLRVKVWPQEESALADIPQPVTAPQTEEEQPAGVVVQTEEEQQLVDVASQIEEEQLVNNTVEDLPTRPLVAPTRSEPPVQPVAAPQPALLPRASATDDVEQILTAPLPAPQSMAPVLPPNRSTAYAEQMGQQAGPGRARDRIDNPSFPASRIAQPVTPSDHPAVQPQPQSARQHAQGPVPLAPSAAPMQRRVPSPISPFPAVASAQRRTETPPVVPVQSVVPPTAPDMASRRNRRVPLMLGLVIFTVLVVGSLVAWIVVRQPFSVPAATQPQQAFANSQLGLSLLYPSGWTAKVDQAKQSVYFSDSSHTGQVTIMVAASSGDLGQYLRTEATHLGMTAIKPGKSLSFAGTSWQGIQGNMQQAGANYAAVLLATTHGGHIYTILQMAPQPVYSQEDQLTFSSMRSSFRFLS